MTLRIHKLLGVLSAGMAVVCCAAQMPDSVEGPHRKKISVGTPPPGEQFINTSDEQDIDLYDSPGMYVEPVGGNNFLQKRRNADDALRRGDFDSAASFYAECRREVPVDSPAYYSEVKTAYEGEIMARISGARREMAEDILEEYKQFVKRNGTTGDFSDEHYMIKLFEAEIALLGNSAESIRKAKEILLQLKSKRPGSAPVGDVQVLQPLALAYLLLREYDAAAETVRQMIPGLGTGDVLSESPKGVLTPRETKVLGLYLFALAAGGKSGSASNMLKTLNFNLEDEYALQMKRLLSIFVRLKKGEKIPEDDISDVVLRTPDSMPSDSILYSIALNIADMLRLQNFDLSLDYYRLAAKYAKTVFDLDTAVSEFIRTLKFSGQPDAARALVVRDENFSVFCRPNVPIELKQEIADLLFHYDEESKPDEPERLAAVKLYGQIFAELKRKKENVSAGELFAKRFQERLKREDALTAEALRAVYFEGREQSFEAMWYRAELLRRTGDFPGASALYEKIGQSNDQKLFLPSIHIVIDLYRKGRDKSEDKNKANEAIARVCTVFLNKHPFAEIPFVLLERADAFSGLGQMELACRDYGNYAALENITAPEKFDALRKAGVLSFRNGKIQKANEYFSSIFKNCETEKPAAFAGYWLMVGNLLTGKRAEAEKVAEQLQQKYPESEYTAKSLLKLATEYSSDPDKSILWLDKLEERQKENSESGRFYRTEEASALYLRAFSEYQRGSSGYATAAEILDKLIAEYADSEFIFAAHYLRGEILKKQFLFDKAIEEYGKAREVNSKGEACPKQLHWVSLGAEADCRFAKAGSSSDPGEYNIPCQTYKSMLDSGDSFPAEYKIMTLYKIARCHECALKYDEATAGYMELMNMTITTQSDLLWLEKGIENMIHLLKNQGAVLSMDIMESLDKAICSAEQTNADKNNLKQLRKQFNKLKKRKLKNNQENLKND